MAILDIQTPGLSGMEVTTAIRQHPVAAKAAIVLTANDFDADHDAYLAAGMNAASPIFTKQLAVGTVRIR